MSFVPLGDKTPYTVKTSNDLMTQILQEFVMLRYMRAPKVITGPKAIAPWIDQAKTYFVDARKSDWRSGGLLYYYSFLNFAKAYLVAKRIITFKSLKSTSLYHGLSSTPQDISKITDFEVEIYPPTTQQNHRNVFSSLYVGVTRKKWPFNKKLKIKVGDIAGYCSDISHELLSLLNITHQLIYIQSLIRFNKEKEAWFEMALLKSQSAIIKNHVSHWQLEEIPLNKMSREDYNDWLSVNPKIANNFSNLALLRSRKMSFIKPDSDSASNMEAISYLQEYAIPTTYEESDLEWLFVPKIPLDSKKIHWHPLLSDYLIAFVLSTILRYQLHLLSPGSPNSFLAETWCSQSSVSTLRQLLMLFTNPPLRVETY